MIEIFYSYFINTNSKVFIAPSRLKVHKKKVLLCTSSKYYFLSQSQQNKIQDSLQDSIGPSILKIGHMPLYDLLI